MSLNIFSSLLIFDINLIQWLPILFLLHPQCPRAPCKEIELSFVYIFLSSLFCFCSFPPCFLLPFLLNFAIFLPLTLFPHLYKATRSSGTGVHCPVAAELSGEHGNRSLFTGMPLKAAPLRVAVLGMAMERLSRKWQFTPWPDNSLSAMHYTDYWGSEEQLIFTRIHFLLFIEYIF